MRVFVTGATGFIGSAVTKELIAAGHQVLGLCRSNDKAAALEAAGAKVYRGSIADPDSLKDGASRSDGVIHLAFNHDFSRFAANCEDGQAERAKESCPVTPAEVWLCTLLRQRAKSSPLLAFGRSDASA